MNHDHSVRGNQHTHMEHGSHEGASCHAAPMKNKPEYLLWSSIIVMSAAYAAYALLPDVIATSVRLTTFTSSVYELLNQIAWGVILGIVFVGILNKIPREFILSLLGKGGTLSGIFRATRAGVLLDLCSHGILMVGAKLYERGASIGQVAAFLIASPWNSFSLTLILWALVGFKWMIAMLLLSMLIAIIAGYLFDRLVAAGTLPGNPNQAELPEGFSMKKEMLSGIRNIRPTPRLFYNISKDGLLGSTMVLKWIFFGVILASLVRTFVPADMFATYFGPSLVGLGLTVVVATILEVCSEGSLPLAADLLTRASAPGNAFAFLMTGVSTDYTEILILKDTTKSWKISLFLPLLTVPQVLVIAWLMNEATLL